MIDPQYHLEQQLALDLGVPPGEHDLHHVAHVGSWHRSTCVCGWQSRVQPSREGVLRHHLAHVRYERSSIDDRPRRMPQRKRVKADASAFYGGDRVVDTAPL